MAEADDPVDLDTNTGSWFQNAFLSDAYLYKTNLGLYWSWGTTQTNDAYIQAPSSGELSTITVNSYTKWDEDNISIRFNIP